MAFRTKVRTLVRRRWFLLLVGWAFIVLGILGLFLPVLQGVLFLLVGLIILSSEYSWPHKLLTKLRGWFPHLARVFDEAAERARGWLAGSPSR
jgi:uncharacterized membrane protein YbaN (DUF454 family)